MKKSLNAFTLLEMLIVICIITIILWFTMNFSWNRIQDLNNKNTQEEFVTVYNEQYLVVSNSNYIDWDHYDQLQISFIKDRNDFSYQYIWLVGDEKTIIKSGTNNVLNKIKIKEICLGNQPKSSLNIQYAPYELWCKLNGKKEWKAIIKIWVNNDREDYCFEISSQLWRLISMKKCPSSCQEFRLVTDDMGNFSDEYPEDDK
jgi:prepilin-type N-terminal cleavage/methylation domain-containing protein